MPAPFLSYHRSGKSPVLLLLLLLAMVVLGFASVESAAAFPFNFNMGGQPHQQRPPTKRTLPNIDYYAELGLQAAEASQITAQQIKQQYRQLSRRYHPDATTSSEDFRGEDPKERFTRIQKAYEVLSDPEKRKMFDLLGEKGLELLQQQERLKHQQGGMGNPFGGTPFGPMFGGVASLKAPNKETLMDVDLLDILKGGVRTLHYRKQCVCSKCKGEGAPLHSAKKRCQQCRGTGVVVQSIQLAPGMVQQVQQACPRCGGEREEYVEVCQLCHGHKVHVRSKAIEVEIPKGAPEGHTVKLEMEGEEAVDKLPGDLVVHLTARRHPQFSRSLVSPADLHTTLTVTLKEALLGFQKTIPYLDNVETVVVVREPGTITPYGTEVKIAGKGLPHFEKGTRGNLFVTVTFQLPKHLSPELREAVDKFF